jgi:hypothetical protein
LTLLMNRLMGRREHLNPKSGGNTMKTIVYIAPQEGNYRITASGTCPDNHDSVSAIGREPEEDEIIGMGVDEADAWEDAITTATL